MKKLVSLALAVITILCLSVPAFATEVTEAGDYTAEVTGSYIAGIEGSNTVYCVDITWEDLDMTYHAAKEAVWDTDNLEYSVVTPAYWEGEGTITVTNRSNIGISATPSYSAAAGYSNANMIFSTDKLRVSTAEFGTEHSGSITVTPTGWLPSMDASDTIGTITLTIAQNTDVTVEEAKELYYIADAFVKSIYSFAADYNLSYDDLEELYHKESCMRTENDAMDLCIQAIENDGIDSAKQNELNGCYNQVLPMYYECKEMLNMYKAQMETSSNG